MGKNLKFPKNFLWGASTSSHQVEGDNINDWSEWERENCKRLAEEAERKYSHLSVWEEIKKQAQNPENYISGKAVDHYHQFRRDIDLAKSLGLKAYRFSIEWSRIEPEEGKFDRKEINHYGEMIDYLKDKGIEPFVTLWHWPIPLWLRDKGGFKSKKIIDYFARYVEKVVFRLKDKVKFWITINEPQIYASHSYLKGNWPPQEKNPISYFLVIRNLIKAHQSAFRIIKKIAPQAQIGIAKNNVYFEAYKNKLINCWLKKAVDWWWNFYFLNQIKNYQDFIGLNYYSRNRINYGFNKNKNEVVSDIGWELYPKAIYYTLKELKKYNRPIYITENGLADFQDKNRAWYIKEILKNIHQAMQEGVDIRGYLYWSLLDNFEWDKGFWPRFGLIKIDRQTLRREICLSALEYAKICKSNSLEF